MNNKLFLGGFYMGFIILGTIIGLIVGIFQYHNGNSIHYSEKSTFPFFGLLGITVGLLFYLFTSDLALLFATEERTEIYEITSFSNSNDYCYVSDNSVTYIIDDIINGEQINIINTKHAYIHKGDYTPTVVIHKYALSGVASLFLWDIKISSLDYIDLYIPEDSNIYPANNRITCK